MCASGVSWLSPNPPMDCMDRSTTLLAMRGATILMLAISALAAYTHHIDEIHIIH